MDADAVVIEYLRRKLKGGRDARADAILKPQPVEAEAAMEGEPTEQELAELEGMLGEEDEDEMMEG